MSFTLLRTVNWQTSQGNFALRQTSEDSAELITPHGQILEMTNNDLIAIVEAAEVLLQTPSGRRKKTRGAPKADAPKNGLPWSREEQGRLIEAFHGGATVADLAATFGRTKGAILARLLHARVIGEDDSMRLAEEPQLTSAPEVSG